MKQCFCPLVRWSVVPLVRLLVRNAIARRAEMSRRTTLFVSTRSDTEESAGPQTDNLVSDSSREKISAYRLIPILFLTNPNLLLVQNLPFVYTKSYLLFV